MKARIITGNKGGVGKSFVTIMLADYLLRHDKEFIVGDAEMATGQATTWNVMRKYVDDNAIKTWKLGTPEGYETLTDDLQRLAQGKKQSTLIIDTGASMMDSLTTNLAFLSEAQADLGVDVGVVFVAGPLPDTQVAAREYLRAQKELEKPLKTVFLLISPTEREQGAYAIAQDKKIQAAIPELNGTSLFLGPIRQEYFDSIMKEFRLPYAILKNTEEGYGFKKKLHMWLAATFDPIAAAILE